MTGTTLYIDVDGVLNAVGYEAAEDSWGWSPENWRREKINGYWITFSSELVDELNRITQLPGVTCKWLTTWCDLAPKLIAPGIGLHGEDWPVVSEARAVNHRAYNWWKLAPLQSDIETNNIERFAWLDDDILNYIGQFEEWASEYGKNVHLVSPDTYVALTPRDIHGIEKFILDK